MDDLLSEFLTETSESLSELDGEIVRLEQNPNDRGLLGNIFRLVHTIKGTCGFLGLPRLESVAHAGENILGKFRDGELEVTPDAVTLILACLDQIRVLLDALEQSEQEPEGDDSELIKRLNHAAEGGLSDAPAAPVAPEAAPEPAAPEAEASSGEVERAGPTLDDLEAAFLAAKGPEELAAEAEAAAAAEIQAMAEATDAEAPAAEMVETKPAEAALPPSSAAEPAGDGSKKESVANQTIRVNVTVLEDLMTMVSELVLTRNQLLQILRNRNESEFAAPLQRLNQVVSELQEGVMATRMQPIGNAWAKLPRIIRDLGNELDKKIDLVMKGAETELDRQVLELIKDPLTHMVRNSADHGLEVTADRRKAGKPETGTVTLNAYHEGGHIIIEISDDGKGLNTEAIKRKSIENGIASEADLEVLSEQQIHQYIFKPGFSTAAKVTAVSGRGVGMDVVRTNIEKISGTVELTSVEGKGTKFVIKIPLTLAIVSALIVEAGSERFAIPQLSVVELVRASAQSEHKIEHIGDTPVLRLRNRLLPLVDLGERLSLKAPQEETEKESLSQSRDAFIVVIKVGNYSMGIVVDRVFDTEEIVVKPMAPILRDQQLFSGNTILGDGSVVMILDPNGIAGGTGEIGLAEETEDQDAQANAKRGEDTTAMLVFRALDSSPKAVPLALIARLEEVDLATVENSNGEYVIQYRGDLMPLVRMDHTIELKSEGRQPVLVFADGDRSMGLVVDEIVDIVEDVLNVELGTERPGFVGTAVIGGKATDIIDAAHYLTLAYQDWFGKQNGGVSTDEQSRLLLVDDSAFFRNLLQPLLTIAGYDVVSVTSATEALELCEAGEAFDLIISDIEMPVMDGFQFAEKIRQDTSWRDTPMVALSSFSSSDDFEKGREVGFQDYVSKTDRDALLTTLTETLAQVRGAA